ncbi:MAG: type pilus assembly protein PilC [Acidobacteriota bacterium]|jgi:type IV pilus assembly protein PilC|nr:type pilus assembly protein PilC [Acidobacteriota bacterium]MDT7777830.1 type pilus assembly protein PilC [Acidobacteriota bacterium]
MAEFICRLGTPAGEVVTRTVEAVGVAEARVRLEAEGFRVFSVAPPRTAGLTSITRGGKSGTQARVKPGDFLIFNQQLSAIIRAGIPILQAIAMLRRRAASSRLRAVLADVEDKIRSGMALSAAFAAQGPIFPRIYTASILAGERSGALDDVLARYVSYMRRGVEIRRKIRGALAYPLFLLGASMGMVMFLTVYVVPKMSTLFEGFNRELPAVTKTVIAISNFTSSNFYWFVPTIIGGIIGLYLWTRTPSGGLWLDRFLLKLPIVNVLIKQLAVAQMTRSLATLLAGGITLVESWEIAAESITNKELRARSSATLPMIREGRSFTESLESAGWIPLLGLDMIGVGERSGSLREMLEEVADFHDRESEVRLEQLTTVMEPAILLVMGGVVVTILLSIYLPIIQSISNLSIR